MLAYCAVDGRGRPSLHKLVFFDVTNAGDERPKHSQIGPL
jgi:hypothetical protein